MLSNLFANFFPDPINRWGRSKGPVAGGEIEEARTRASESAFLFISSVSEKKRGRQGETACVFALAPLSGGGTVENNGVIFHGGRPCFANKKRNKKLLRRNRVTLTISGGGQGRPVPLFSSATGHYNEKINSLFPPLARRVAKLPRGGN